MNQSFIAYCTDNILRPQFFFAREASIYTSAFLGIMICPALGILLSLVFRFYLVSENRRRNRFANSTGNTEPETIVLCIFRARQI